MTRATRYAPPAPRRVQTSALEPLEPTSLWVAGETLETYPTGL
jgi:hypothetical protein